MSGKLLIMLAPARAGKSTWSKNWLKVNDSDLPKVMVNSDSIRLALHGERFKASREKEVHKITEVMVKCLFSQEFFVNVDDTNTTVSSLRKWLRIDPSAIVIYLDTPQEECERRAYSTEQPDLVEKGVISRMFDNLRTLSRFGGNKEGVLSQENIHATVEKIRAEILEERKAVQP